jgi:hypothetical protein
MRILTLLMICCLSIFRLSSQDNYVPDESIYSNLVDDKDTIIYDFAAAFLNGNKLAIPIFIKSDEQIFSIDFSLNFNESVLKFDTIIKVATELEMAYFVNPNDKKLRLTGYSIKEFATDKKILTAYFTIIAPVVRSTDIFNISSFLNGDPCSTKLSQNIFMNTALSDISDDNIYKIYPNPAQNILNIECQEKSSIFITDIYGKNVLTILDTKNKEILDLKSFSKGIYIVYILDSYGKNTTKKFIKN